MACSFCGLRPKSTRVRRWYVGPLDASGDTGPWSSNFAESADELRKQFLRIFSEYHYFTGYV